MISTTLNIVAGNTINLKLDTDSITSREKGLNIAQKLNLCKKGFYSNTMKLVIPKTPFKKGTKQHYPDAGLHITIALDNKTTDEDGKLDVITKDMEIHNGVSLNVMSSKEIEFMVGDACNDEAVGAVFYVAQFIHDRYSLINKVRSIVGLKDVNPSSGQKLHISLAGIAPLDGDYLSFRKKYVPDKIDNKEYYSPLKRLVKIKILEHNEECNIDAQYDYAFGSNDSALTFACSNTMNEVALKILKHNDKSKLGCTNKKNETALLLACKNNMLNVALEILKHVNNCNFNQVDVSENTALKFAKENKMKEVIEIIEKTSLNTLGYEAVEKELLKERIAAKVCLFCGEDAEKCISFDTCGHTVISCEKCTSMLRDKKCVICRCPYNEIKKIYLCF